ncbi:MAG: conjugal transfer protein TrbC [Streptococcus sp.]|nr:conjugal transfer protein TrbC [Streptococcus sp.]
MKNKLTKTFNKVSSKVKSYLLSLSLFLSGLTNTAYADDPFSRTSNLAQQGISKIQGIGIVTFSLAVVGTGIVYACCGREGKAAIKKHWLSIAVGIIAVAAGPSIIEWVYNFVKG